jgi:hypothetical protein
MIRNNPNNLSNPDNPNNPHTRSAIKGFRLKLAEALTQCEIKLPAHWSTAVRHFLGHFFLPAARGGVLLGKGPSHVSGTLGAERINKNIKAISQATNGIEESIARGIGVVDPLMVFKLTPSMIQPPAYLRPGLDITLPNACDGVLKDVSLNPDLFSRLRELWAEECPLFSDLLNAVNMGYNSLNYIPHHKYATHYCACLSHPLCYTINRVILARNREFLSRYRCVYIDYVT